MKHVGKDLFVAFSLGPYQNPGAIMVMWKMSWISSPYWGPNKNLSQLWLSGWWWFQSHDGSTGRTVYLPTFWLFFFAVNGIQPPKSSRKSGSVSAFLAPETFGEWTWNLIYRWWQLKWFLGMFTPIPGGGNPHSRDLHWMFHGASESIFIYVYACSSGYVEVLEVRPVIFGGKMFGPLGWYP